LVGPWVDVGVLPAGEPVDPVSVVGPPPVGGIGFGAGVLVGALGDAGVGAGVLGFVGVPVGALGWAGGNPCAPRDSGNA
jgi:hypothetical protein